MPEQTSSIIYSPSSLLFLESRPTDESNLLIVGAPFDGASSYRRGAKLAPTAIRRASQSIESYSDIFKADLADLDIGDVGNLSLSEEPEAMVKEVAQAVVTLASKGSRLVVLGGDHSVTVGVVKGLTFLHGRELQVAILDAHSDWRDEYEGSRYNHACTIRRICEVVDTVRVGGVRSFVGREDASQPIYVHLTQLTDQIQPSCPLYLSVDIDVFDPSVCPGVSNPEPGGISYKDAIAAFERLQKFPVVGFDIVELCPTYDPSEISAITAAKLVQEGMLAFFQNLKLETSR